jgi:hypothetical protein
MERLRLLHVSLDVEEPDFVGIALIRRRDGKNPAAPGGAWGYRDTTSPGLTARAKSDRSCGAELPSSFFSEAISFPFPLVGRSLRSP